MCAAACDWHESWRATAIVAAARKFDVERRHDVVDDLRAGFLDLVSRVGNQRAIGQYSNRLFFLGFFCHASFPARCINPKPLNQDSAFTHTLKAHPTGRVFVN